jgi:sulfur carrier protein
MQVTVNGEKKQLPAGTRVAGLIELMGLGKQPCAVEVNRALVPKREHAIKELSDGDTIEVVTLVGGG